MNQSRRGECENVVELLVKEYFAKYRSDLNRKIGSITAEFIRRGLFNSSGMVTEQMGAEFWYLDGLVNYVIGSLKEKFRYIPLFNCKDKLVAILDTEYKRLIPKANSLLVKAGLANQANLDRLQKRILDELERAKGKIEIQCALSEKEKSVAKSKIGKFFQDHTIQGVLMGAGVLLFISIIGWYINNSNVSSEVTTSGDSSPGIIISGPNSPAIINYNSSDSKQLQEERQPSVKKDGRTIKPEETEADVNEAKEKRLRKEEAEFDKANRTGDPGGMI